MDLLVEGHNNSIATLQYTREFGIRLGSLSANKLRDPFGRIHPRRVHPCFFDDKRFQPSPIAKEYLRSVLTNALGSEDVEQMRATMFNPGKLSTRYQSVSIDIQRRIERLK